jgi:hypothetical protein
MDVDRIAGMSGLGQSDTAWPNTRVRRRKFMEEVAPAESEAEEAEREEHELAEEKKAAEQEEGRGGRLNLMA